MGWMPKECFYFTRFVTAQRDVGSARVRRMLVHTLDCTCCKMHVQPSELSFKERALCFSRWYSLKLEYSSSLALTNREHKNATQYASDRYHHTRYQQRFLRRDITRDLKLLQVANQNLGLNLFQHHDHRSLTRRWSRGWTVGNCLGQLSVAQEAALFNVSGTAQR